MKDDTYWAESAAAFEATFDTADCEHDPDRPNPFCRQCKLENGDAA